MTRDDFLLVESRVRCLRHLLDAETAIRGIQIELGLASRFCINADYYDRFLIEGLGESNVGDQLEKIEIYLRSLRQRVWDDKQKQINACLPEENQELG